MTSGLKQLQSNSNQTKFLAWLPGSPWRKIFLIVGGMMISSLPLIQQDVAIAQTYPQYSVTAEYTGGNCLPIRNLPRPDAYMVECVPNGSTLETVIGEQNGWLQLNSRNWTWKASTSLGKASVSKVGSRRSAARSFPVSGVIVQTPAACSNVRKAPSTGSEIVACLENGEVLKTIVQEQNGWLQLSSGNWIWKNNTNF